MGTDGLFIFYFSFYINYKHYDFFFILPMVFNTALSLVYFNVCPHSVVFHSTNVLSLIFQVLFILSIVFNPPLTLGPYVYPGWAVALGWVISCSSLTCVPAYIIYRFTKSRGRFMDVSILFSPFLTFTFICGCFLERHIYWM